MTGWIRERLGCCAQADLLHFVQLRLDAVHRIVLDVVEVIHLHEQQQTEDMVSEYAGGSRRRRLLEDCSNQRLCSNGVHTLPCCRSLPRRQIILWSIRSAYLLLQDSREFLLHCERHGLNHCNNHNAYGCHTAGTDVERKQQGGPLRGVRARCMLRVTTTPTRTAIDIPQKHGAKAEAAGGWRLVAAVAIDQVELNRIHPSLAALPASPNVARHLFLMSLRNANGIRRFEV